MSTGLGHLVLKGGTTGHPKQPVSDDTSNSKVTIDHQNSSSSSSKSPETMSSKNHADLQPKKEKGNKKKKKSRRGNDFSFVGNNIKGNTSDRVGIFGFGNTHVHKQVDSSSEETNSAPSEEEQ